MAFSANSQAEINVTPLIDVLLVLLIIFMVIVPQHQRGLNTSIPQGKSTSAPLPPVTVQIVRHAPELAAQYLIGEHVVPSAELKSVLAAMFAVRDDHTLIIQADRELSYQEVATVVGVGKQAGAMQVALNGLPKR